MYLSHIDVSLPLSPSLPLSKIFFKKGKDRESSPDYPGDPSPKTQAIQDNGHKNFLQLEAVERFSRKESREIPSVTGVVCCCLCNAGLTCNWAKGSPWLTTSVGTGTSVSLLQGTGFCQQPE